MGETNFGDLVGMAGKMNTPPPLLVCLICGNDKKEDLLVASCGCPVCTNCCQQPAQQHCMICLARKVSRLSLGEFAALPAGRALFPIPRQRDMARSQIHAAVDDALDAMAKACQVFLPAALLLTF